MRREALAEERKRLNRLVDELIILEDKFKIMSYMYMNLAMILRARMKNLVDNIINKFDVLFDKIEELKERTRSSVLMNIDHALMKTNLELLRSEFDSELTVEKLEELVRLGKRVRE